MTVKPWSRGLENRLGDFRRDRFYAETDLPGGGSFAGAYPFAPSVLASGVLGATSEANHPGIVKATSSVNVNSGGAFWLGQFEGFTYEEGLHFEAIFKPQSFTNVIHVLGLANVISATVPTNGIYVNIDPTTGELYGVSKASASTTMTPSYFNVTVGQWYRVVVEAQRRAAVFSLYDESGAKLWGDEIDSGLPGQSEKFGALVMSYVTVGGAQELVQWDWIAVGRERLRR